MLDRSLVDLWIKTDDLESFTMSRRLIKEEGLLCGGSCGTQRSSTVRQGSQGASGVGVNAVCMLVSGQDVVCLLYSVLASLFIVCTFKTKNVSQAPPCPRA